MAFTTKTYRFKNAIEREQYYTARYGAPGQKRQKKQKPTPEQMEKINQYIRERTARRKLREHFRENDYFADLTYRKDKRPLDMGVAKSHFKAFIRKLRKEYRKRGHELKWIRNIEVGTRGAWHIHLVVNRIPDTDVLLAGLWEYGGVHCQLLYTQGEFRKLAAYITKTPKTDSRLKESSYSTSKNLPLKDPEVRTATKRKTWGKIRVPAGWYLDPDSVREGINPVTGYPYRHYTLLRIRRKGGGEDALRGEHRSRCRRE